MPYLPALADGLAVHEEQQRRHDDQGDDPDRSHHSSPSASESVSPAPPRRSTVSRPTVPMPSSTSGTSQLATYQDTSTTRLTAHMPAVARKSRPKTTATASSSRFVSFIA